MKRFLLAIFIFSVAVWLLRRMAGFFEGAARPGGSRSRGGSRSDQGGAGRRDEGVTELVRDRVCNTFVPKDRALVLKESDQIHFFCSEACRSRHIAGAPREIGAAQRV